MPAILLIYPVEIASILYLSDMYSSFYARKSRPRHQIKIENLKHLTSPITTLVVSIPVFRVALTLRNLATSMKVHDHKLFNHEYFNHECFNHECFNHESFNHGLCCWKVQNPGGWNVLQTSKVIRGKIVKSLWLKSSWLKSSWLKSSWFKS